MSSTEELVKVGFRLEPEDWDGLEVEWLWAAKIGSSEYRIESFPFFAYGISFADVVCAALEEGRLFFQSVLRRGGHSTYRLLLEQDVAIDSLQFRREWEPLGKLGCSFELAKTTWLSVDIPPTVDIHNAYSCLESGEGEGVWKVFEGFCGHLAERVN